MKYKTYGEVKGYPIGAADLAILVTIGKDIDYMIRDMIKEIGERGGEPIIDDLQIIFKHAKISLDPLATMGGKYIATVGVKFGAMMPEKGNRNDDNREDNPASELADRAMQKGRFGLDKHDSMGREEDSETD